MSKETKSPDAGDAQEEAPTLEGRLKRLEEILGLLEADEVELEKALGLFEEGVKLVREAEEVLSRTELRVEELLSGGRTQAFQEEEDEA